MKSKTEVFFEEFPFLNTLCDPEKIHWTKVKRIDLDLLDFRLMSEIENYHGPHSCTFGAFDNAGNILKKVEIRMPWYGWTFPPLTILLWYGLSRHSKLKIKNIINELGPEASRVHTLAIHRGDTIKVYKPPKKECLMQWIEQLRQQERESLRADELHL